jgi:hypothetical protein
VNHGVLLWEAKAVNRRVRIVASAYTVTSSPRIVPSMLLGLFGTRASKGALRGRCKIPRAKTYLLPLAESVSLGQKSRSTHTADLLPVVKSL